MEPSVQQSKLAAAVKGAFLGLVLVVLLANLVTLVLESVFGVDQLKLHSVLRKFLGPHPGLVFMIYGPIGGAVVALLLRWRSQRRKQE